MRIVTALLIFSLIALPSFAAQVAGEIIAIEGKVEVLKEKQVLGKAAKAGTEFKTDELIRTKRNSSAEIGFVDGSAITIYEKSRLLINGIERGQDYNADIQKGRVLFDIASTDGVQGEFKIQTTTSIIGVKGTSFFVQVSPERTTVSVLSGLVEVRKLDSLAKAVLISPGKSVTIKKGSDKMNVVASKGGEAKTSDTDSASEDSDSQAISTNINNTLNSISAGTHSANNIYQKPSDRINLNKQLMGKIKINVDFKP